MFKMLINMLFITNVSAQMLVGGTRMIMDVLWMEDILWCEETQICIRSWENECNTLVVTEPGPVIDCNECPSPMPCPLPDMPELNLGDCRLNNNIDECGCQTSCPSYDCSQVVIPDNCATWYDGCNTCQVKNGKC